jgi:kinetochore protein Spc7/SPC105
MTRKKSPGKANSKATDNKSSEGILIDFSSAPAKNLNNTPVTGAENLANPFDVLQPGTVNLRTEEEQQVTAKEREEKEKRDQQRRAILDQRAARRKSLGISHLQEVGMRELIFM